MSASPNINAAVDYSEMIEALATVHAQPLWDRYMTLAPRAPRLQDPAHIWRWRDMLPFIERAVREVHMDHAERRVLLLSNPAFGGRAVTTTNLSAGLQILEPGEHALAHRHSLSALRFVMSGTGATTIVDGKRCPMAEGDLILTPTWTWHEHVNEGGNRVVWFDGLDLPLAQHLDSVFLQLGPADEPARDLARIPDEVWEKGGVLPEGELPKAGYSPQFRYPWASALQSLQGLQARPDRSKLLRYTNPVTGGAVIPTLDCYLLELAAHHATVPVRSTSNAVCVVAEGEGETLVGDERIEWTRGDIFTLPHWKWVTHEAHQLSRIFLMTDRELMAKIGYLREETDAPGVKG
jgi:gentisate 1,2-dioxygenase